MCFHNGICRIFHIWNSSNTYFYIWNIFHESTTWSSCPWAAHLTHSLAYECYFTLEKMDFLTVENVPNLPNHTFYQLQEQSLFVNVIKLWTNLYIQD